MRHRPPIEVPPPKGCACWAAIARQIVLGLFPLRLQLRPFQRQSDPVGACLDGANRSIQFCRDHFGAGVRFRHSSKEVILLWRPPVAAEFNHVTTISPSPSAGPPNVASLGLSVTGAFNVKS